MPSPNVVTGPLFTGAGAAVVSGAVTGGEVTFGVDTVVVVTGTVVVVVVAAGTAVVPCVARTMFPDALLARLCCVADGRFLLGLPRTPPIMMTSTTTAAVHVHHRL